MPTDFRYVPVSGDLSGMSFEKQTEQAFNELGVNIDESNAIANEAKEIAQSAQVVAQQALDTAQQAVNTAQEANATANEAKTVADGAQQSADTAQDRADSAYDLAANAETKADAAQTRADDAYSLAEKVETDAATAQQSADAATQIAQTAMATANDASNIHDEQTDPVDLNDYYTEPRKLYLTNAESLNMPIGISIPLYVSVAITDTLTSATQFAWMDTAPEVLHVRTAKVVYPDDPEEDYYAEWSEWASMGSGGGVPSGFIGMWSGAVDQIPEGWLLCDGQNGTPDLRDRFIVGAGTTYAVGATGGAASVTPAGSVSNTVAGGTVANTTLATWQIPSHAHPNYGCGTGKWNDGADWRGISGGRDAVNVSTAAEGGSGAHHHGFTGTSHGHTFTGSVLENRPPYYALAYIMKA